MVAEIFRYDCSHIMLSLNDDDDDAKALPTGVPKDDAMKKGGWGGQNVSKSDGVILVCSLILPVSTLSTLSTGILTLALLPAAEEGQLLDHDCVCPRSRCLSALCPVLYCSTLLPTCGCFMSNCSVLPPPGVDGIRLFGGTYTRIE